MVKHQKAAMAPLTSGAPLKPRQGQFLGGIAFDPAPLTDRQRDWLDDLLIKHGLPTLAEGADA